MMTIRTLESGVSGGAIYKANSWSKGCPLLPPPPDPSHTPLLALPRLRAREGRTDALNTPGHCSCTNTAMRAPAGLFQCHFLRRASPPISLPNLLGSQVSHAMGGAWGWGSEHTKEHSLPLHEHKNRLSTGKCSTFAPYNRLSSLPTPDPGQQR